MIAKKNSLIKALTVFIVLLIMILSLGCTATRKAPAPKPIGRKPLKETKDIAPSPRKSPTKEEPQKPPLPKSLGATDGQEPSLKVFIKDEDRVEEMKLEDYIVNVVAGEIKNDWPQEAIKAQAIIARTFVLNFIDEKGQSKYGQAHVSTDIEEAQAWNPEAANDRIKKAVEETRGQIMIHDNKFVQGWFHSNAAGKTATPKEGLNYKKGDPSYIKTVESPDDSEAIPEDEKSWECRVPKSKVIEALDSMGNSIGDFSKVGMGHKGPSGRTTTLSFDDTQVSAPDFRIAIGSTEMKSTMLDKVEISGDEVIFKGRGYGHGVGMSQWGAHSMAQKGKKADEILSHYFKGVEIIKMWE